MKRNTNTRIMIHKTPPRCEPIVLTTHVRSIPHHGNRNNQLFNLMFWCIHQRPWVWHMLHIRPVLLLMTVFNNITGVTEVSGWVVIIHNSTTKFKWNLVALFRWHGRKLSLVTIPCKWSLWNRYNCEGNALVLSGTRSTAVIMLLVIVLQSYDTFFSKRCGYHWK